MRRRIAIAAATLTMAGCASQPQISDYKGTDAGHVVLGMGAANGTSYSWYRLFFRKAGVPREAAAAGAFTFFQTNAFYSRKPDYESADESGVVIVDTLPPGHYEMFNFDVFLNAGMIQNNYSSRVPFSIPFEIKAGAITYLGNYQAHRLTGKNVFGMTIAAGAVFVVTDRQVKELALARGREAPAAAQVLNMTPSVASIGNPFFATSAPPASQ